MVRGESTDSNFADYQSDLLSMEFSQEWLDSLIMVRLVGWRARFTFKLPAPVLGFLSMPELFTRVGVTKRNLLGQALELSFSVFNLVLKTELMSSALCLINSLGLLGHYCFRTTDLDLLWYSHHNTTLFFYPCLTCHSYFLPIPNKAYSPALPVAILLIITEV